MKKPIVDHAEVCIDFPDKMFHGSFGRGGSYEAHADEFGAHISLSRTDGEKRDVAFHLQYYLLGDILLDLAADIEARKLIDDAHREYLQEAATRLRHALRKRR